MLTGIVSSKEGHDESHIDDTKLKKKFWNFEYDVSIGQTQKSDMTHEIGSSQGQDKYPID